LEGGGDVYCWGSSRYHQIGEIECDENSTKAVNEGMEILTPTRLGGLPDKIFIVEIACGLRHSALVTKDGKVLMMGFGKYGELGHGNTETCKTPTVVEALTNHHVVHVACGWKHTLCLTDQSSVLSWGDNSYGQLGVSGSSPPNWSKSEETHQADAQSTTQITSSSGSSATVVQPKIDGSKPAVRRLRGKRGKAAEARSSTSTISIPVLVQDLADKNVQKILCGWSFSLAVTAEGQIYSFGRNNYGQLGRSDALPFCCTPKPIELVPKVAQVVCGSEHVVALTEEGEVLSWGWNEHGNLGTGDVKDRFFPQRLEAFECGRVKAIYSGGCHSFALCMEKS
jgi:alpha-tubulin suppressor-like RCC1 family protein